MVRCRDCIHFNPEGFCEEGGYTEIGDPDVDRQEGDEWHCSGYISKGDWIKGAREFGLREDEIAEAVKKGFIVE